MCTFRRLLAAAALAAALGPAPCARPALAGPATLPDGFSDDSIAASINLPVGLAEVPDPATVPTRRVLFVEQTSGRVGLVIDGAVTTVGSVPGVSTTDPERGLLGIAVDPGWPARPYLYTHSTDERSGNHIAISRFTVTGDLGFRSNGLLQFDPGTRYDLRADFPDNAGNHNGGTVHFGPDGRLYVSLGDDATYCPALDLTVAVGKILRLDVSRLPASGSGPAPYALIAPPDNPFATSADSVARLVWAEGLRNPFRFTIDPPTGALVIGDVGLNSWEEVDLATTGGLDFEWPLYEGPVAYTTCSVTAPTPMVGPIAYYPHPDGEAIIGGPRYRRPANGVFGFPTEYEGDIFFLDYYTGFLRRIKEGNGSWSPASAPGQPNADDWGTGFNDVPDLEELSDGSLWYCRQYTSGAYSGEIRRIRYGNGVPPPPPPPSSSGYDVTLARPWPNPSRSAVTIAWTQPGAGHVILSIYGTDGRRVRALYDGDAAGSGQQQIDWDGLDDHGARARPGLYFVRLEAGGAVRKARLIRLSSPR